MSLLAALVIATAAARVESVAIGRGSDGSRVRLTLSDGTGTVSVQRDGEVARVSLPGAQLGLRFAGDAASAGPRRTRAWSTRGSPGSSCWRTSRGCSSS